jgi:hypothetical protein
MWDPDILQRDEFPAVRQHDRLVEFQGPGHGRGPSLVTEYRARRAGMAATWETHGIAPMERRAANEIGVALREEQAHQVENGLPKGERQ